MLGFNKSNFLIAAILMAMTPMRIMEEGGGQQDFDDIDSLLDADLGSIEDLPDFVLPPAGFYKLVVKKVDKKKKVKDKSCVSFTFAVEEAIQLNNPAEEPVKQGSLFSQQFFPDTSVERQHMWRWLKKAIKGYLETSAAPNLSAGLDSMQGQMITAVITHRPNEDKTQYYPQVDKINAA